MSTAPRIDIDVTAFWQDPYPALARLRKEAPIAFVPQLNSTLLCSRDDIFACEKRIDVFSSHQPEGLMNKLMGHNMMRKDAEAHMAERNVFFPAVSPRAVKSNWIAQFQAHADRIIDDLPASGPLDFVQAFALPFSAECLKSITGLTNMRFEDMNAWSQGMIDGIANYTGVPAVEALAAGVPVVANRAGALPEVVGDAGDLVDARDPYALAEGVMAALESSRDPERHAARLEAARRRLDELDLATAADRTVDLVSALWP